MPIASRNKTKVIKKNTPNVVSKNYNTITEQAKEEKVACGSNFLTGSPWPVTYYSQRLKEDNELAFQDQHLSPSYQSYSKINDLILSVSEALDTTIDEDTVQTTVRGQSRVLPFMVFNTGDMFIASIGSGTRALFRVTDVAKYSHTPNGAYTLRYTMVCPIENDENSHVVDLENKTVSNYYYDAKLAGSCKGPLLSPVAKESSVNLRNIYTSLMNEYNKLFFDRDTDLYLFKVDNNKYFDQHLTEFILRTVPFDLLHAVRGVTLPEHKDYHTILDHILDAGLSRICDYTKRIGFATGYEWANNWTSIQHRFMNVRRFATNSGIQLNDLVEDQTEDISYITVNNTRLPILPKLYVGDYILSDGFSVGTVGSVMEVLVQEFMNETEPQPTILNKIIDSYKKWSPMQQYYYTPLLLLLIKTSLGE